MSDEYRFEIDASAGPAREGLLYGRMQLLVRVRLFDGLGVVDTATGEEPAQQPDVITDLRPEQARHLALRLLSAAENAERQTLDANWWKEKVA